MPYVVVGPGTERRLFESWAACEAAVRGRPGIKYMKVHDPVEAQQVLDGGVALPPGLFAFTDANAAGGIGIVIVKGSTSPDAAPEVLAEVSTTVHEALAGERVEGLHDAESIAQALSDLANIFSEMVALLAALSHVPEGAEMTVVYDYKGVEAFMTGEFGSKDPAIRAVVSEAHGVTRDRNLKVLFRHQRGHSSTWAGRHDYAQFNALADALASRAVS